MKSPMAQAKEHGIHITAPAAKERSLPMHNPPKKLAPQLNH